MLLFFPVPGCFPFTLPLPPHPPPPLYIPTAVQQAIQYACAGLKNLTFYQQMCKAKSIGIFFSGFFLLLLYFLDRIRSPCSHTSKGIFNSQSYASCFQKLLNDTDSIVSRLVCEQFAGVVAGAEFKEPPSSFLTESKQSAAFICFSHVYHSAAAEPLILSSLSLFICLDSLSHRGKLWLRLSCRRPSVPLMQRPALSVLQDNQLT